MNETLVKAVVIENDSTPPVTNPPTGQNDVPTELLPRADQRESVGRFRIVRLLGKGGMGSVYLAHDTQIDRNVALKIPRYGPEDGEMLERFLREARAAGRLHHPNVCPVLEVGEADGVHYRA